uniref:Protein root UVB sensitive/RUS domain-containing protein n=1 Tax=Palpitomonas bilix TaxID=652834 RepID=A0A7S3DH91_9EUKA|mmetsp:Transcript_378/g.581  ORF Transcript_378/g.581 Transcript_378/m.581 type:complete len:401 (+) Transcript_378:71-1273(+)
MKLRRVATKEGAVDRKGRTRSEEEEGKHRQTLAGRLSAAFAFLFLPSGYPASVTSDYAGYQLFDTLQAFCSAITGLLATQSLLRGMGVGDATATAASAIVQWVTRDGIGRITTISFASAMSGKLDAYAKQWRYMADILNDGGMLLEIVAPISPTLFMPLSCLGSVLKSITGVAGGSTKAALTQHFAVEGNLADVAAKDNSQETAVSLLGTIVGTWICGYVEGNNTLQISFFALFTLLHLWTNWKGIRCLRLNTLNRYRLLLLWDAFVSDKRLLNAEEVAGKEAIVFVDARLRQRWSKIELGVTLAGKEEEENASRVAAARSEKERGRKSIVMQSSTGRKVVLLDRCTAEDVIEGFCYALAEEEGENEQTVHAFVSALQASTWRTDRHLLEAGRDRYSVDE